MRTTGHISKGEGADQHQPILVTGIDRTPATNQPWATEFQTTACATGYNDHWKESFDSIAAAGITTIRHIVLMQEVVPRPGMRPEEWNWSQVREELLYLKSLGIDVIADICHHDARPAWMEGGLSDPAFPEFLTQFALGFLAEFPWVNKITVMNEPYPTTHFCTIAGSWFPFRTHDSDAFVRMILNLSRAVCMATRAIAHEFPYVEIYQNESCEDHRVANAPFMVTQEDHDLARFCNQRSQIALDLLAGSVDRSSHPLGWFLTPERGFTPQVERWFQDHPAKIDCLMLDYYFEHEHRYYGGGKHFCGNSQVNPVGFAEIVAHRYGKYLDLFPGVQFAMGETNLIAHDYGKLTWWGMQVRQKTTLWQRYRIRMRFSCWFGWDDTSLWCSHQTKPYNGTVEGVGFHHIDPVTLKRSTGLGFEIVKEYTAGRLTPETWPAYTFEPALAERLRGWIDAFLADRPCLAPPHAYLA